MKRAPGPLRLVGCALALALAASGCAWFASASPGVSLSRAKAKTEELRGLRFRSGGVASWLGLAPRLRLRWIDQAEVGELSRREVAAKLPAGFAEGYRDAYASLGVFPRDLDLLAALMALHEDQLVGVYSPRDRTLYVVRDAPAHVDGDAETILVHELVHALQHDHFERLMRLVEDLAGNDDVLTGVAAAIEGDASYTMTGVPLGPDAELRGAAARDAKKSWLADVAHPSGVLAEVPLLLRESLLFPYAYGVVLASRAHAREGNAGLDALLASPPLSSARVVHPDDRDPVEFVRLPEAALAEWLDARGCRLGQSNVAGAVTIDVLFRDHADGERIGELARRWAGDRFLHVACTRGPELLWITRWDDAASARAFAERYAAIAPSVARAAGFEAAATVALDGRSAVVASPGVADLALPVLRASEIRAYEEFDAWWSDGCFPTGCPK
jgi:hypothetical protein